MQHLKIKTIINGIYISKGAMLRWQKHQAKYGNWNEKRMVVEPSFWVGYQLKAGSFKTLRKV